MALCKKCRSKGQKEKGFLNAAPTKAQVMNSSWPQRCSSFYLSKSSSLGLGMEMAVYNQSLKHVLYPDTSISVFPWDNYSSLRIFPNSREPLEKITTVLRLVQILPKAQILECCINSIGKGCHEHLSSRLLMMFSKSCHRYCTESCGAHLPKVMRTEQQHSMSRKGKMKIKQSWS